MVLEDLYMKKFLAIFLTICFLFIFSSCTSNTDSKETNPYQVTEKATKINEDFKADEISKVTVTIGGNENEIDKSNEIIDLLEKANTTKDISNEELSTIAAFIKIYYEEKEVDYGVIYLDSEANAFLSSNYNQNENAVLKIEDQSLLSKLIFPNLNLFNFESTDSTE